MMPLPALLLPALMGAGIGAATSKKPLQGALMGGVGGALTGGLGGLGGAASGGAAGLNASGSIAAAMPSAGASASLAAPSAIANAVGQNTVQGTALGALGGSTSLAPAAQLGQVASTTPSAMQALMKPENLESMGNLAGTAAQMGMFQPDQAPPAASAGIPGGQSDFTGLLARRPEISGAQLLMMQRQARRGR